MLISLKQLELEINKERQQEFAAENIQDESDFKSLVGNNVLGADVNLQKRKEMIRAVRFEPEDFAYERAIGRNDSLFSNFTELIALTKRKVGRIVIKEDGELIGYGTGFMVAPSLMITNWHVFKTKELASNSEVYFFYEYNNLGRPLNPTVFRFDTTQFYNNKELDYCLVGVEPTDVTGKVTLKSVGYLFLDKTLGKIGEKGIERLNIIHHPQGDYKQISIRENTFVDINETKIFYETDTAPGSSGSPVFNDQWQVVGLHHRSVPKMAADGVTYLDSDDNPIPVADGKIDASKIVWLKNEGIRISVILKHIEAQHPDKEVIKQISIRPPEEVISFSVSTTPVTSLNENSSSMESDKNIVISIPPSALSSETTLDISLSKRGIAEKVLTTAKLNQEAESDLLNEISKADKEQAVDFKLCRGYLPDFLGVEVPLPQPKKSIQKQIAKLSDKSIELKYFHYSVIFNAVRKMPLISAVNVEGDADKRLDNSKRSDDWLRDKRIDIESQLTDKFYSKSGFDKGHMGRFEDANWDDTEEKALRNGIYTCFYTNACPQVPGINRQGDNLWGKLEKAILEKGVKNQSGKQARMSVFNGPIFDETKDRVRLGVTVPMQFYKIVLWLNDANKLRATGFKLSQETLVTDDQFDESVQLGEEAIDIDKLVSYKKYQCSIKKLGALTKIDFSHIEKYDTYKSTGGDDETALNDAESLML